MHDPDINYVRPVIDGALAGHYELPESVTELIAARERLADALERVPQADAAEKARTALRDGLLNAAIAGKAFPTAAAVTKAEAQDRDVTELRDALRELLDRSSYDIRAAVENARDEITRTLQRGLAEVVARAAKCTAALGGAEMNADSILACAPAAHVAYQELRDLGARYVALSRCHERLWSAIPPQVDIDGYFTTSKNGIDMFPPAARAHGRKPPWPTDDSAAFLVWAHRNGLVLWLPTRIERDEYAVERFPDSPPAKRWTERRLLGVR